MQYSDGQGRWLRFELGGSPGSDTAAGVVAWLPLDASLPHAAIGWTARNDQSLLSEIARLSLRQATRMAAPLVTMAGAGYGRRRVARALELNATSPSGPWLVDWLSQLAADAAAEEAHSSSEASPAAQTGDAALRLDVFPGRPDQRVGFSSWLSLGMAELQARRLPFGSASVALDALDWWLRDELAEAMANSFIDMVPFARIREILGQVAAELDASGHPSSGTPSG